MRKIVVLASILILCCVLLSACAPAQTKPGENLVRNGGFEQKDGSLPKGWEKGMWVQDSNVTDMGLASGGYESDACAYIDNIEANDARWEQTISVKPNTLYRFSARIRAEGCDPMQKGANLSIKDIYGTSPDQHDTDGVWESVEFFGRTGSGQRQVTLMARLGGYGSEALGKAWFDDVEVREVSDAAVPEGAVMLQNLKPQERKAEAEEKPSAGKKPGVGTFFLLGAIGALFALLCMGFAREKRPSLEASGRRTTGRGDVIALVLGAGLVLRLIVVFLAPGYQTDVNCFTAWAGRMLANGPSRFYAKDYFCDYPPGYLYVLWVNGLLMNVFHVSGNGFFARLILRGMPILCDLVGAFLLYRLGRKRLGERAAIVLAASYVLNPAVIVTGAAWGQVDAVLALGIFCTVWLLEQRKWQYALPAYVLCVLVKPQALMAGPLGVLALVAHIWWDKEQRLDTVKRACIGFGAALVLAALFVIPFWGNQDADWLIQRYGGSLGTYNYATLSAGNLLYVLGGNWVVDSKIAFAGISWNALGIVGMTLVFAYVGFVFLRGKRMELLWACSALLFAGLFTMGLRMHERYLLPAIPLLCGAYSLRRDWRYWVAMVGFSVTMLINVGMVLTFEHLISPFVWIGVLLGWINLGLVGLVAWAVWEDASGAAPRTLADRPQGESSARAFPDAREHRLLLTRLDWLIMLGITLAYAVLAYWGLGDVKAPQSQWKPTVAQQQAVLDLGEERDFTMCYFGFGGTGNDAFSVAFSDDGTEWSEDSNARMDGGICFRWVNYEYPTIGEDGEQEHDDDGDLRWQSDSGQMHARYVRITSMGRALELKEVAFRNPDGGIWPVASATGENAARLVDEQDTVPERSGYMNGTYFDEIYHARTGYEFLHDIHTYEWTHPPLGKLLIMLSIQLFGMTPFGWRFAGATIGILMLPALYLLAKQLWKRTDLATFVTLLMTLDCMHYTQTRIATIDSYPVFFIILMYLFMFRYVQMSFYRQKLWKTLIPLALCGLASGLAIASKWIGFYAMAGLAVLLFYALYRRFAEWRIAQGAVEDGKALRQLTADFVPHTMITLGWCVIWFLVVPAAIYYFSYTVQFHPDGGLNWKRFWSMQESMYSYHSALKATHPYESKWWQWPIIAKPMWYYSTARLAGNRVSTILSFGNPAVWWVGLGALITVLGGALFGGVRSAWAQWQGKTLRISASTREALFTGALLVIGFASQYLPWVLVPRSTYIYHYFASVPFIILCIAQCAQFGFKDDRKLGYWICGGYLVVVLLLFIAFFPFASGIPMSESWAKTMQWIKLPY